MLLHFGELNSSFWAGSKAVIEREKAKALLEITGVHGRVLKRIEVELRRAMTASSSLLMRVVNKRKVVSNHQASRYTIFQIESE
jgi:hypothetical protein